MFIFLCVNEVLLIKYKKHTNNKIHKNKQIQHHLTDKFIILIMMDQAVLHLQVLKVIVKSQIFFIFEIQCTIRLLFISNRMTYVIDILIKVSLFTLIRDSKNSNAFSNCLNCSKSHATIRVKRVQQVVLIIYYNKIE